MEKPTILREKAYIPSASEYDAAREKYLAFMGAKLSQMAKDEDAWEHSDYGAGYFFLRSALSASSSGVLSGLNNATRGWHSTNYYNAGLRVAFNLIYSPEVSYRMETRKVLVYNPDKGERETAENTAPIVKFGKYDCLWLNKEECETAYARGETALMQLWTLDLVACAVPFAENDAHTDYAKAVKLREQCHSMFTEEELAEMLTVEMSNEDRYEKATPIWESEDTTANMPQKDKKGKPSSIHDLFAQVAEGTMDEEDLRKALKEITAEMRNDENATEEDARALAAEIASEADWLKKTLQRNAAFKQVDNIIDSIRLGGEDEN